MNIYETLLLFALVFALAAFFVMWAKWEEEKLKTREERKCYEAMLRLHNGVAARAQELDEKNRKLKEALKIEMERTSRLDKDCAQLEQNLRSALRCPNNDHVWKDGVCVKCGRMKDG